MWASLLKPMTGPNWTAVRLEYRAEAANYRLIFGRPVLVETHEKTFGYTRETAWFAPGSVFGLDLWEGALIENRAGERRTRTRARGVFVLQALASGEAGSAVKRVQPGVRVLMYTRGVRRSQFMLAWLAELALRGNPANLDPSFFELKQLAVTTLVPEREKPSAIGFPAHGAI